LGSADEEKYEMHMDVETSSEWSADQTVYGEWKHEHGDIERAEEADVRN
jgi:hypothetical protein